MPPEDLHVRRRVSMRVALSVNDQGGSDGGI